MKRIVVTLPECFMQNTFTFVPDRKDPSLNLAIHGVSYFVPVLKIEIFYAHNSMQIEYHMESENEDGMSRLFEFTDLQELSFLLSFLSLKWLLTKSRKQSLRTYRRF